MKLTASKSSENGWLEDDPFLFGAWGEIAVSFREGRALKIFKYHVGLPQGYHFY